MRNDSDEFYGRSSVSLQMHKAAEDIERLLKAIKDEWLR